jgi:large subunit ribosomal protein L2
MSNNIINYNIVLFLKKKLAKGVKSTGGRNFLGRVCIKGKGLCNSSTRKLYRYLDFYRRINKKGILLNILYDPNRSGKIGLILYENGLSTFILLQKGVPLLSFIYSGESYTLTNIKKGDSTLINNIPLFSVVSNIENKPFKGGTLCRAAGVSCLLISKDKYKGILKMNSGWQLSVPLKSISSYGIISNKWNNKIIGKAGKNRGIGKKPKVRGVAMNPCDHPHGGGNGKRSKPSQPVNAWNTVFKWTSTKKKTYQLLNKRLYKYIIK